MKRLFLIWAASTLSAQVPGFLSLEPVAQEARVAWTSEALGGGRARVTAEITIPEGFYIDLQPNFLSLDPISLPGGTRAESLVWSQPGLRHGLPSFSGSVRLSRVVYGLGSAIEADFLATWQICDDDGVCSPPSTAQATLVLDPGPPFTSDFLWQLALAFVGGLLLNFMPCVFPLLGIKALSLARLGQKNPRQRVVVSLGYTLGVESAMLAVGTAIALAVWLGANLGWGMHFQNPTFLMVTGGFLWALALGLWGVYPIPSLKFFHKGETVGGSFLTGLFSVFVAAPCTAPFLGGALAFALSLPSVLSIFFFLAAGLGFAFPYLILGFLPGLERILPKPGAWMETFERLMGFLMAGVALYVLSPLVGMTGSEGTLRTVVLLFGGSFLLFIAGRWGSFSAPDWRRRFIWIGAFVGIGILGFFLIPEAQGTRVTSGFVFRDGWKPFTTEALTVARVAGKPIFVDIRADWCSICKLNEATVLSDRELLDWIDARGVLRLRGDYTLPNADIAAWLSENRRAGLPAYALYPPGGQPIFLPEILTKDGLRKAVENLVTVTP